MSELRLREIIEERMKVNPDLQSVVDSLKKEGYDPALVDSEADKVFNPDRLRFFETQYQILLVLTAPYILTIGFLWIPLGIYYKKKIIFLITGILMSLSYALMMFSIWSTVFDKKDPDLGGAIFLSIFLSALLLPIARISLRLHKELFGLRK